jgi:hypothetical protein
LGAFFEERSRRVARSWLTDFAFWPESGLQLFPGDHHAGIFQQQRQQSGSLIWKVHPLSSVRQFARPGVEDEGEEGKFLTCPIRHISIFSVWGGIVKRAFRQGKRLVLTEGQGGSDRKI